MALINVPLSGQSLAQTRVPINTNFNVISLGYQVDHAPYNSIPSLEGKHFKVTMPVQGSSPATLANEMALFTRTSSLSGLVEAVLRRSSNGDEIEFTSATYNANGWTRLPSGILLKWGNGLANGLTAMNFPVGASVPVFTTVYQVIVVPAYVLASDSPNAFARLNSFNTTQLEVFGSPRSSSGTASCAYNYLAIGI